jgi:hypothetical protein
MQNKSYYIKFALGIGFGVFLFSTLFGDFYPAIKSLFFKESNTKEVFETALDKINWFTTILKPLIIGSFVTVFRYFVDKKQFKKSLNK